MVFFILFLVVMCTTFVVFSINYFLGPLLRIFLGENFVSRAFGIILTVVNALAIALAYGWMIIFFSNRVDLTSIIFDKEKSAIFFVFCLVVSVLIFFYFLDIYEKKIKGRGK